MKKILLLLLLFGLNSCKLIDKIKPNSSKSSLISYSLWKLETLRDSEDKDLKNDNLPAQAKGLYGLDFDFKANKIVRALDRGSKQVLGQGTWALSADEQTINIDLPEFKGDFKVVQLSSKSFLIQYASEKKFAGLGIGLKLLLVPADNL